jgi:FtsP/CotA-like multicopper oxidase with cupredoxin domain
MSLTRRDLIQMGVLGSAALALPLERVARTQLQQATRLDPARLPAVGQLPIRFPPDARPVRTTVTVPGFWIDPRHPAGRGFVQQEIDYYAIHQRQVHVPILPGVPDTWIWGYDGITPGPAIHAERGRPALVRFFNDFTDQHPVMRYGVPNTSVHLHGNPSLAQHDGYASDVTAPGGYKDYWYPAFEDARTLWYHDHAVHDTAANAYMGLAGAYLLHDDEERASGLPLRGALDQYGNPYDCPMIVRDAMFDSGGQLIFNNAEESGVYGDVILVNGVPWPNMRVEPRKYRFRFCNAAVSRSLILALSAKGSTALLPMTVVATDAGLMHKAVSATSVRFGMAERYEIVIDFSALKGKTLLLRNLRPINNVEFPTTRTVMQFEVGSTVSNPSQNATVPGTVLRAEPQLMQLTPTRSTRRRTFDFVRQNGHWTINGKTWADVIDSGFQAVLAEPEQDSVEVWRLRTSSGGWHHPVHIHLVDFKILSRTGQKVTGVFPYERGPKDVVFVGEYETVDVIARFGPQVGRYMMHCHNLMHEDHDMMHQFRVKPAPGSEWLEQDPMGWRWGSQPADGALHLPPTPDGRPQFPPPGA